jgi:hypothetical protein
MSDMIISKPELRSSITELESLCIKFPNLNELVEYYEIENLVENLKQILFKAYKSMPVYTDKEYQSKLQSFS